MKPTADLCEDPLGHLKSPILSHARARLEAANVWPTDSAIGEDMERLTLLGRGVLGRLAGDGCFGEAGSSLLALEQELGECFSMTLDAAARTVGFGALQTAAFGRHLAVPAGALSEASDLGGLFNLGITLFDHVQDVLPHLRARLNMVLNPRLVDAVRGPQPLAFTGKPALDLLLSLIERFFGRLRMGPSTAAHREQVLSLVEAMFAAEVLVAATSRRTGPCPPEVVRALETKSVGPSRMMLLIGQCFGGTSALADSLADVATAVGRVWWLADDLADAEEDMRAGHWSALWVEVAGRSPKTIEADGADWGQQVVDCGAVDPLVARLIEAHRALQVIAGSQDSSETWTLRRLGELLQFGWWSSVPRGGSLAGGDDVSG